MKPHFGPRRERRRPGRAVTRPGFERMESRQLLAVFTVTSASDSGAGTLRAEIELANSTAGLNTIDFAIGTGQKTITVKSPLPELTNPVIIDGTSQPGSSGRPAIEINGVGIVGDGLEIGAGGSTIDGLVVDGFTGSQIHIMSGADGNTIEGNSLGTDPTGTFSRAGSGAGLFIESDGNLIGGLSSNAVNVISGNGGDGVTINGSNNRLYGNVIGSNAGVSNPVANGGDGVRIIGGSGNSIGGAITGAGNTISGNRQNGVEIFTPGNSVQGNAIGTSIGASRIVSNIGNGLVIANAANNTIGGTVPLAANSIAGNEGNGVVIYGTGATGNLVFGNFIGTALNGSRVMGNSGDGLLLTGGASQNQIGGIYSSMQNVIGGNGGNGIDINNAALNVIQGNAIGTTPTGSQALGNAGSGIWVSGDSNLIGGLTPVMANVIRNNGTVGVTIAGGHRNAILNNSIYNNTLRGIITAHGANDQIAAPVVHSATAISGTTIIRGAMREQPKTDYLLQFFSNAALDPSGFGEGQTLIGQATINTRHSGYVKFQIIVPTSVPAGQIITAVATDPTGNSSAFSNGIKSVVQTVVKITKQHTSLQQAINLTSGNGIPTTTTTALSMTTETFLFGTGFRGTTVVGTVPTNIVPGNFNITGPNSTLG